MNTRVIAQSSLTYAYKGEGILRQAGIPVKIIRLSSGQTVNGCGYGLSVPADSLSACISLLKQRGAFVGQII